MTERLFRSARVVLPTGMRSAAVRVGEGRIIAIEDPDAAPGAAEVVDVGHGMLLPGLVDTHVHVNEPGRTDWEGFETATRAAAAGGITTLLDMPLNCIPATTRADALREKIAAAQGKCHVDVGFIGGVVPGNVADLAPLYEAGVLAWKCFLVDSGVPEFACVDERTLRAALPLLARLDLPLMVHAEVPGPILRARRAGPLRSHREYAAQRPEKAEVEAIELVLRLAAEFHAAVHIVHLASCDAISMLEVNRRSGVRVTVETCPHYLTFASEDIPHGATEYKCAPPIRSAAHRDALWSALQRGAIDFIASDHSPSPPALKRRESGDFAAAWGGIASLQVVLSAVWHGARARDLPMSRIVQWMCQRPAELVRLQSKGRIAPGCDADLVVWDPDEEWTVDGARLEHRHSLTPYHGMQLPGRVVRTYLRGNLVYENGNLVGNSRGRLILRDTTRPTAGNRAP